MRVIPGLFALCLLQSVSTAALADDVSKEDYLDLGQCEGFYLELIDLQTSDENSTTLTNKLSSVQSTRDALQVNEAWQAEYKSAVAEGRRGLSSRVALGGEQVTRFVERRQSHCDGLVASLAPM